jgi:hypothetical protein
VAPVFQTACTHNYCTAAAFCTWQKPAHACTYLA